MCQVRLQIPPLFVAEEIGHINGPLLPTLDLNDTVH